MKSLKLGDFWFLLKWMERDGLVKAVLLQSLTAEAAQRASDQLTSSGFTVKVMSQIFHVNVALPNGHAELLTLLPFSTIQDLRAKAQRAFGKKYLGLVTAKNRVLDDPSKTLEEAEIEDGECLTALVLQPQLAATSTAFALWCHGDSTITTWGSANGGGDNGSVVTWGDGGDSSAVGDQLRGVQKIQATWHAYAAILEDGTVVTWGDAHHGGDSAAVRDQLRGVQQIQATREAFAAILADGSVVTWGSALCGGDSSAVGDQLGFA
eukprot:symbB.v1.2.026777.t1/scaffold2704.1/size72676/2